MEIVENGIDAVKKAKQTLYAVIILDCQMPEMSRLEATLAIRKAGINRNTPIIGLTAMPASLLEDEWVVAGIDSYVTKPLEGREFVDTVYRLACGDKEND